MVWLLASVILGAAMISCVDRCMGMRGIGCAQAPWIAAGAAVGAAVMHVIAVITSVANPIFYLLSTLAGAIVAGTISNIRRRLEPVPWLELDPVNEPALVPDLEPPPAPNLAPLAVDIGTLEGGLGPAVAVIPASAYKLELPPDIEVLELSVSYDCTGEAVPWQSEYCLALSDAVGEEGTNPPSLTLSWTLPHTQGRRSPSTPLNTPDMAALIAAIQSSTTLRSLILYGVEIRSDAAVELLATGLLANANLIDKYFTELQLIGAFGEAEGVRLIGPLRDNHTLTYLNLSGSYVGPEGMITLAGVLGANATLTALSLESCSYSQEEWTGAFADALRINTTLTGLNLSGNYIGIGIQTLAQGLLQNAHSRLTDLNVASNWITVAGAVALLSCTGLRRLHLHSNNITGDETLAQAIARHPSLEELVLFSNPLVELNWIGAIANNRLAYLDVSFCQINDKDAFSLAEGLQTNTALFELIIHNNYMTVAGIKAILGKTNLEGVVAPRSLKAISLSAHITDESEMEEIGELVRRQSTITRFTYVATGDNRFARWEWVTPPLPEACEREEERIQWMLYHRNVTLRALCDRQLYPLIQ